MELLTGKKTYIAVLFAGLLLAGWPRATLRSICVVMGILLILGGVFTFRKGFVEGRDIRYMAAGVGIAAVGGFFCAHPMFLLQVLPVVLGILIMANALWRGLRIVQHYQGTERIAGLAYTGVVLLLGLYVVLHPNFLGNLFVRIVGLTLILSSFFGLVDRP